MNDSSKTSRLALIDTTLSGLSNLGLAFGFSGIACYSLRLTLLDVR